jgi:HPt (histidine-containing phosphotransfer) domain-containing protein
MDAYLAKPLQPRELAAAIEGVVGGTAPPAPAGHEASPPPAGQDAFDLERLLERVGGDRRALAELVRIFRADAPKQLARIRRAVEKSDAAGLRAAAHALKGAVSNFAAPPATEAALRLQKMGDTGHLQGAAVALGHLESELDALLAALADVAGRPARRVTASGARGRKRTGEKRKPRRGRRTGPGS